MPVLISDPPRALIASAPLPPPSAVAIFRRQFAKLCLVLTWRRRLACTHPINEVRHVIANLLPRLGTTPAAARRRRGLRDPRAVRVARSGLSIAASDHRRSVPGRRPGRRTVARHGRGFA